MDEEQAVAFAAFVNQSGGALLRTALFLTSDRYAAEDVYQETMHQLSRRWSKVDSPLGFCRRVMHNIVIDRARVQRRRPHELELHQGFDDRDPRSGDTTAAVELRPALFSALDTLTAQQRAVVLLRYCDDRTANEVAAILGISTGTVKSTASRAMARLRTHPALVGLLTTTETSAQRV